MGTNPTQRGPTAETVSANVARLRSDANLGLRALAKRMGDAGRPLTHSAVDQIEKGARRVDVDDLMALAVALDVSPVTLLMPVTKDASNAVDATGQSDALAASALWDWLTAAGPLPGGHAMTFLAKALPHWLTAGMPNWLSEAMTRNFKPTNMFRAQGDHDGNH